MSLSICSLVYTFHHAKYLYFHIFVDYFMKDAFSVTVNILIFFLCLPVNIVKYN